MPADHSREVFEALEATATAIESALLAVLTERANLSAGKMPDGSEVSRDVSDQAIAARHAQLGSDVRRLCAQHVKIYEAANGG